MRKVITITSAVKHNEFISPSITIAHVHNYVHLQWKGEIYENENKIDMCNKKQQIDRPAKFIVRTYFFHIHSHVTIMPRHDIYSARKKWDVKSKVIHFIYYTSDHRHRACHETGIKYCSRTDVVRLLREWWAIHNTMSEEISYLEYTFFSFMSQSFSRGNKKISFCSIKFNNADSKSHSILPLMRGSRVGKCHRMFKIFFAEEEWRHEQPSPALLGTNLAESILRYLLRSVFT